MADKGKNKHRQITCFDQIHQKVLLVDSNEECDTLNWLTEAYNLSILKLTIIKDDCHSLI